MHKLAKCWIWQLTSGGTEILLPLIYSGLLYYDLHEWLMAYLHDCIYVSLLQLRPPQPATYVFLFDVSHNAIQSGYLKVACDLLLENLDGIPGDARTQVAFITYDSRVHFYCLSEDLSQPQMLIVSDIDGNVVLGSNLWKIFPADRDLTGNLRKKMFL